MTGYTAYLLDDEKRKTLLDVFEPSYKEVLAHHITLEFGVGVDTDIEEPEQVRITHLINDGNGLEALVVEVNGAYTRPDGQTYHITWSIDPDAPLPDYIKAADPQAVAYEPKHANLMIAKAFSDECPEEFSVTELECKLPANTLHPQYLKRTQSSGAQPSSQAAPSPRT